MTHPIRRWLLRAGCLAGLLAAAWCAPAASATDIKVAVAANFLEPAKEIAKQFAAATGHRVRLTPGSSGGLYAQIANGAPFDLFLSSDITRPQRAEGDGLGVAGTRFTYARGRLVLFSRIIGFVDKEGAVLKASNFHWLAIPDPATVPYGAAAVQTLKKLGLYDSLQKKLLTGASTIQAYQMIAHGSAELGFMAQSQLMSELIGSRWVVPEELHTPLEHQAILLKTGADNAAAKAFLAFLKSPQAIAIIRDYGYTVD
jgi:molybdate transport system substrate-binding protein